MNILNKKFAMFATVVSMMSAAQSVSAAISEPVCVYGATDSEPNEYRIPALGNDGNGTLLAFIDDRGDSGSDIGVNGGTAHVLYKISKDNGATWSEAHRLTPETFTRQHGDAAVAFDASKGRFVVLFVGDSSWGTGDRGTIWATWSTNADYTAWSEPKDVTSQFVPNSRDRAFASSGTMMYLNGEVYVVLCKNTGRVWPWSGYISNVLYKSSDGGESWTKVSDEIDSGDESHVVSTSNGIVMSRRANGNGTGYKYRNFWQSTDGGQTFSQISVQITESGCNGDLMVYKHDGTEWLLQTINKNRSGNDYTNRPLVICASQNGGSDWSTTPKIDDGEYACLTTLADGKIGLYYEKNDGQQFRAYFRTLEITDIVPTTEKTFEGYLNTNKSAYLEVGNADAKKLAEVAGTEAFTVTVKVRCSEFETGDNAADRGVFGDRQYVSQKQGLITYNFRRGVEMYGGNANNPFGINVSVTQDFHLLYNSSPKDAVLGNTPYTDFYESDKDKWTHITLVFNPAEGYCRTYVNGKKFEDMGRKNSNLGAQYDNSKYDAKGKGIDVPGILAIGTRIKEGTGDMDLIWQGGIDDLRFYDKALTDAEIEADIKAGFPLFTGGNMRGAFDFSAKDSEAKTMTDITGKSITATERNNGSYTFPETDQNATQVNVTVVDREGNVLANGEEAYKLNRYIDGAVVEQANGAKASVNTDFMIQALKNFSNGRYELYMITVNGVEVDPFDFSVTNYGVGSEYTGGFFKSSEAINDVKVIYNHPYVERKFVLVGENHSDAFSGGNWSHVTIPYQLDFIARVDEPGVYDCAVNTDDAIFRIMRVDGGSHTQVGLLTGIFHVDELQADDIQPLADNTESAGVTIGSYYSHEAHRQIMSHEAVKMAANYEYNLQNVTSQTTPIHFTTNQAGSPTTTYEGLTKPTFILTFTPTKHTLMYKMDGSVTGVEDVAADNENAPVEMYTLQGVRVSDEQLTPGFYIRKQGRKVVKVLVR